MVGRGQLWFLGLMATTRDSWGYEEGLSFALPSPLPATHASVSPVTEGLCWGMGAMEEVDEASESYPRDTRHCACSRLGPLSSVCPPRGTGDPLLLQGKVREMMVAVGAVTLEIGAELMPGPTGGQRDPPVPTGRGQGSQ